MLSKYSKSKPKNEERKQKKQQNTLRLYRLSSDLVSYLEKTLKNGINAAKFISFERIIELCQSQLRKISQFKSQDGQTIQQVADHELTVAVVGIQSKIILEEKRQADFSSSRLSLPDRKRQTEDSKDVKLIKRYENLLAEIQKSQSQIRIFLDRETAENELDFTNCYFFFVTHVRKLRKLSKEKIVSSRVKLLQTMIFFLKQAAIHLQPQMAQKIQSEYKQQSIIYGANASFLDSSRSQNQQHQQNLSYEQVNNWPRYSSRFIQDKIVELSGICQQIPQLQTYKRTLQFAQLESNQKVYFFKVVDVLISLHHKVSYLSRNKPQLLKQLQQAKCQINFMNTKIDEFLAQMMDQANQILPINFQGLDQRWKSQLSHDLIHLRGHLHKLSQIIIRQDQIHTQNYAKVDRLIKIVQLFGKVLSGESQFAEQWEQLVNQQQRKDTESISNQQYRVIMLLEQCLAIEHSRIQAIQQNQNNQVNRTNQELQIQVNKLIQDYQRLKSDNSQLANTLQMERRLREQLLVEVDQRDKIIKNISAKKLALQKKIAKADNESVASSRAKDGQYRKIQHQAQKYLESSLLLKEQLKVSEGERQKLLQQLQTDKHQYLKAFQSVNRLKPQKDRLEIQCEQLNSKLEILKNEQLRQTNRLNKIITDLNNQKSLLQMQLDTAQRNNLRLIQRLDSNDKKIAEYNKLMMARLDEKDDNSSLRIERQLERYRKQSQNYQKQTKEWQLQNKTLRDELSNLKFKLKQSELHRQNYSQSDHIVEQMRNKLQKLQNKNNSLSRTLDQSKGREEELQQKLRNSNKKVRQLENKQRQLQSDKARSLKNSEQSQRKCQDLQRQLDELRHWNDKQVRNAREMISKKQIELLQRVTSMSALQLKIRMLEDQVSQKSSQSEKVTQQLIETKVKQYQTTIQTHKLIQLKLEQKARGLQKELEQKIEVEFKLTSEIDRLSKEIDRMKAELQKYLRELSQKQLLIKIQRQKIDEQVKQIRQYQVKQKVRDEQMNTPHHDKPSRQDQNTSTPSHFEDPMSRSNIRYDNYFNAKEYDRLSKQYSDFKKHASQKLQALESSLEEALKEKAKLKAQQSMAYSKQRQIEPINKNEINKSKLEQLTLSLKLQIEKNSFLQEKLQTLTLQNQNLTVEVQKSNQKQSQQTVLIQQIRKQKKETNDRLSQQVFEKQKLKLSNIKQNELLQKIRKLQAQIKELEQQNNKLKNSYAKLESQMENQTKNMFNHYQAQMKRVIAQTDSTSSRLSGQVQFLKKQLQIQQNPNKLQKEKQQTFNQLKRSIELLLSQKNKLLAQNSKLQKDKNSSDRQKIQSIQQLTIIKQKLTSQNIVIRALQQKNKSSSQNEQSRRKIDELTFQLNNLIKQRDQILAQNDQIRKNLEQQTKRAIYLDSQLTKTKADLQQERCTNIKTININDQRAKNNVNVDYLYAKIKTLEDALQAVGDQLSDSKNNNVLTVSNGGKMIKSQIVSSPQSLQLRRLIDLQRNWTKKQRVYLQQLESMSRQIYTLKQTIKIQKQDRSIVTSLPPSVIPTNNTYHQNPIFNQFELIKVEKVLQGKKRWQGINFAQSLSKWGLPSIVCQQVQDLRNLFMGTSQIIGTINQQQINLQLLIESLPSLQNLLEFILRILSFFSEINLQSPQAVKMRNELQSISKQYTGGYLFTVLQEYTIHILQNNAIEQYKRELRQKARELLEIKQKLDQLITQQLQQEDRIYNRAQPTARRSLQPGVYHSSSYSSLSSSRNK